MSDPASMTGAAWIAAFAAEIGIAAPDEQTINALLALASTAAHASERLAAPLACYLVGQAGITVERAQQAAAAIAAKH